MQGQMIGCTHGFAACRSGKAWAAARRNESLDCPDAHWGILQWPRIDTSEK